MPSYKLIYVNGRGKGEPIRLMFALAGVEYEDYRLTNEEWAELKPKSKFGLLPTMEIDGKPYTQSRALLSYLAKEFGFHGSTKLEALEIEEVIYILEDFFMAFIYTLKTFEDKKEEALKKYKDEDTPKYLAMLEKVLKNNQSGYMVGEKLTVADVFCFDFVSNLRDKFPGCSKDFPLVEALVDRVGNVPNIKAWVEKRPVTPF